MSYIRSKAELRTGYQENSHWKPELDLQCDFIMTYGLDDTLKERIKIFRDKSYEVHLMTGCAWGNYEDYLNGIWDGKQHWDECQTDRNGEKIMHGINTPYMVPTQTFIKYLTEKLCNLVDYGISAIHMEEPEFWDNAGYSEAFKKEYALYYGQPWQPPHTSINTRYKCSKLKAFLYARLINSLSKEIKKYSIERYGKEIKFYVATHSIVNYTQWKIMSPECRLIDIDTVDGFIAQVWSGTSGTANVYKGKYESRTFETAYFEYGFMNEMVKNTGKIMWFLHDPVEDFPENGWDIYRKKYIKTMIASLFWKDIYHYEVCPWPNRVFNGRYPKKLGMGVGMMATTDLEGAKDIPTEYATMLSSMIQLLGNMKQKDCAFLQNEVRVGIFMSDSSLYQRSLPDTETNPNSENEINDKIISLKGSKNEQDFYKQIQNNNQMLLEYISSCTYPNFFGLVMPLLKHGLFLQPVYMEHIKRYKGYLNEYRYLILSYEHMKPEDILYNEKIVEWVKNGGCLIYIGDESDPYNKADGWWNENKIYQTPAQHLFSQMKLSKNPKTGIYTVNKGYICVYNISPALLSTDNEHAEQYRSFVKEVFLKTGYIWNENNYLCMKRGPYHIVAVMEESLNDNPYIETGLFTDLLADGYPIIKKICINSGEEGLFFNYEFIKDENLCIIATAARIEKLECDTYKLKILCKAADRIHVNIRIRLPWKPERITAIDETGNIVKILFEWDIETQTILISYESKNKLLDITGLRKA